MPEELFVEAEEEEEQEHQGDESIAANSLPPPKKNIKHHGFGIKKGQKRSKRHIKKGEFEGNVSCPCSGRSFSWMNCVSWFAWEEVFVS